jgi:lipopolysaccharide transport system permease protein
MNRIRIPGENISATTANNVHASRYVYQFNLIAHLTKRNFVLRYKGSILGILWSALLPLSQLLVLVFLFGKVISLKIEAYPAFVFTGLLPWNWFSMCMTSAGGLFIGNRDIMRNQKFTPSILAIVATLTNLLTYLIFLPILLVLLVIYNRDMTWSLLIFPLLLLIQGILTVGLSLLVATANVFYRDVQHIVSMAVMLLFYITPVFYQTRAIGENYRVLYKLNPVAVLIEGYGAIFFHGTAPDWESLLSAGIISIVVCVAGYYVYKRQVHNIFDLI